MAEESRQRLLPRSRQYGLIDSIAAELVKLALAGHIKNSTLKFFDYADFEFVSKIVTPYCELSFGRNQGATSKPDFVDIAALSFVQWVNVPSGLGLSHKGREVTYTCEHGLFKAPKCASLPEEPLPAYLTYQGWGDSDHAPTDIVHYVKTEEVTWAYTQALQNLYGCLAGHVRLFDTQAPEVTIHQMRADLFPFPEQSRQTSKGENQ